MHVLVRALRTQEIMRSKDAQCNSGELPFLGALIVFHSYSVLLPISTKEASSIKDF